MGSRLLSFTYGGYTIAEQIHKWSESIETGGMHGGGKFYVLSVDFLITADGASSLHTAIALAEAALVAPEGNLVITMDGSNRRSYTSGTDTRLVTTKLVKPGSEFDTETSNLLRFEYRAQLGLADDGGRASHSGYALMIDASGMRMVHMHGTYAFNGATTARAQYTAGIAAWVTSAFTALGLTEANYELVTDSTSDPSDEAASVDFARAYEEVMTTPANANIKLFRVNVSAQKLTTRGDASVEPALIALVRWSCNVDHAIGDDEDLLDLYEDTVRPDVVARIKAGTGATTVYILEEDKGIDESRYVLSGSLRAECYGGAALFFFTETLEMRQNTAKSRRRRWSGVPGDYVVWSPGPVATATIVTRFSQVGAAGWSDPAARMKGPPDWASGGFWDRDGYSERSGNELRGEAALADGRQKFWGVEIATSWFWMSNRSATVPPSAPAGGFGGLRGLGTTTRGG